MFDSNKAVLLLVQTCQCDLNYIFFVCIFKEKKEFNEILRGQNETLKYVYIMKYLFICSWLNDLNVNCEKVLIQREPFKEEFYLSLIEVDRCDETAADTDGKYHP